jgi:hypothetical protein
MREKRDKEGKMAATQLNYIYPENVKFIRVI